MVGSVNQKIESHKLFLQLLLQYVGCAEVFLSHPETESAVTFLKDKWIFVVRVIQALFQ